MSNPLGIFTKFADLDRVGQRVVQLARQGADSSADNRLCFQSDFPVGAAILATNAKGGTKFFVGCNVENAYFPPTICAERNAATTAAVEGYTRFLCVAVLCRKYPGGSPCGLCRQVLTQFGLDAVLLNVVDHENNVRRATVGDLLPAASGKAGSFSELSTAAKRVVMRLENLKSRAHVPYSKRPQSALFTAYGENGKARTFSGVADDNASYGGSALAETVAMRTARTAGYSKDVSLIVSVQDPCAHNPLDGESLQVLREFGADAPILLVGADRTVVSTRLTELLPDSFGPESL